MTSDPITVAPVSVLSSARDAAGAAYGGPDLSAAALAEVIRTIAAVVRGDPPSPQRRGSGARLRPVKTLAERSDAR